MTHLVLASTAFLAVHAALGLLDGVYLHLWRYRLHAHPSSQREHRWHTLRAVLFPFMVATLYLAPPTGWMLWTGVAIVAVDLAILLADVIDEPDSRAPMGGLPGREYMLHVVLVTAHIASVTLLFAALPLDAWSVGSTAMVEWPEATRLLAVNLLPGGVGIALLHVVLAVRPSLLPAARATPPVG